jgi:hypothetical protein
MRTKEEYYELVLENRRIAGDPDNLRCPCPNIKCEWHGRCKKCVALHRYHRDHIPNCFQEFIRDKIESVASIVEMVAVEKEKTPDEYRDYVKEMDKI